MEQDKKLAELLVLRESYRHKAFMMMFEILVIFGLPAVIGFFLGSYIRELYSLGKWVQVVVLLPMLAISWVVLIVRYRSLDKELKDVNRKIKEIRGSQTANVDDKKQN